MRPNRHSPALERWLRLEAAAHPFAQEASAEAALTEAFVALPGLRPRPGFALRVVALALAPAVVLPGAVRRLSRWAKLGVAASLFLSGSAWLSAPFWAPVFAAWLRPGEIIDGAAFALRESVLVFVRGLSTWQALAEVSDVLLRVLATPDATAAVAAMALAALAAFHALRGVLVAERSVYRV